MNQQVIFLDVDGTITTLDSKWQLNPEKFKILGEILDKTNAKIVISSSWRRDTLENTIEFLTNTEINPYVNNNPFPFVDKIIGQTDRLPYSRMSEKDHRGREIKKWIEDNNYTGKYIIIDDDCDFLEEQIPYHLWTKWDTGLEESDIQKALDILNENSKI